MDVPILVCGCGMRLRAPGARPGRVGRCPRCGGRLEVPALPDIPGMAPEPIGPAGSADRGFGPLREIALGPSRPESDDRELRPAVETRRPTGRASMTDGLLPVQRAPETSWLTSFLYPMRGAESLAIVASIGVIAWIFTVLVPEYCLQAMADTAKMGASLLGTLFVGLAILPVLMLGPLVLSYWLQYLGRVLVSSAMGECVPPRTPDRNFEGFFSGLSPWLIWSILGLGVGLAPALGWALARGGSAEDLLWPSLRLAVIGLPYILAALMLCFLHEDALAATPGGVIRGLFRLGASFQLLSGLIAATLGLIAGGFALMLWVRAHLFWPYVLMALVWWISFVWVQVVVMRLLGVYYFHGKDALGWNRAHPRWGVAWRH